MHYKLCQTKNTEIKILGIKIRIVLKKGIKLSTLILYCRVVIVIAGWLLYVFCEQINYKHFSNYILHFTIQ